MRFTGYIDDVSDDIIYAVMTDPYGYGDEYWEIPRCDFPKDEIVIGAIFYLDIFEEGYKFSFIEVKPWSAEEIKAIEDLADEFTLFFDDRVDIPLDDNS
jgi:hypothetical protein